MHARRSQKQKILLVLQANADKPLGYPFYRLLFLSSVQRARKITGFRFRQLGGPFFNPETQSKRLTLRNWSLDPDSNLRFCDSVQLSHEGESFKAEEHNDVVFCFFSSPHPGPVPSETPHLNNTTSTTPAWAHARLWMNEEVLTSLLSSFDVVHWGFSVYRIAACNPPHKHLDRKNKNQDYNLYQNLLQFIKPLNVRLLNREMIT